MSRVFLGNFLKSPISLFFALTDRLKGLSGLIFAHMFPPQV